MAAHVFAALLGEAYRKTGRTVEGLNVVTDALTERTRLSAGITMLSCIASRVNYCLTQATADEGGGRSVLSKRVEGCAWPERQVVGAAGGDELESSVAEAR